MTRHNQFMKWCILSLGTNKLTDSTDFSEGKSTLHINHRSYECVLSQYVSSFTVNSS